MIDLRLLRSQRKEVYDTLARVGIADHLPQFQWSQETDGTFQYSILSTESDTRKYYFKFPRDFNMWHPEYFPGAENLVTTVPVFTWLDVLESVTLWAKRLAEELLVADPWEDLAALRAGFLPPTDQMTSNDSFTMREASIINEKLRHLEQQIASEFARNDDDLAVIKSKLEYLIGAMDRQGKKDWLHTSIGVFATMAMSIGVSAANADTFWKIVKGALDMPVQMLIGR
jgi:hypothetical protein